MENLIASAEAALRHLQIQTMTQRRPAHLMLCQACAMHCCSAFGWTAGDQISMTVRGYGCAVGPPLCALHAVRAAELSSSARSCSAGQGPSLIVRRKSVSLLQICMPRTLGTFLIRRCGESPRNHQRAFQG